MGSSMSSLSSSSSGSSAPGDLDPDVDLGDSPGNSAERAVLSVFFGGTSSSFSNTNTHVELFGRWASGFVVHVSEFENRASRECTECGRVAPVTSVTLSYLAETRPRSVCSPCLEELRAKKLRMIMTQQAEGADDDAPLEESSGGAEGTASFKMLFDGCGVTNGLMGTLFAVGLAPQVTRVVAAVNALLAKFPAVTVNAMGLSRGGMACLMLAHALQGADASRVALNLLLFDPVPGNSLTNAAVSGRLCFANQCMHVDCACLARVVALYPHEPLPDAAFHAPIIPRYGAHTQVVQEVILGCHQGACWSTTESLAQRLSFCHIHETLLSFGTAFEGAPPVDLTRKRVDKRQVIADLNAYCSKKRTPTSRRVHCDRSVEILARESGTHLNRWHMVGNGDSEGQFLCEIVETT